LPVKVVVAVPARSPAWIVNVVEDRVTQYVMTFEGETFVVTVGVMVHTDVAGTDCVDVPAPVVIETEKVKSHGTPEDDEHELCAVLTSGFDDVRTLAVVTP
jgi:hypothetical protein